MSITKRQRFIVTTIILTAGFFGLQFLDERYRFLAIGALGVSTTLLFAWSLREGLGKNATLLVLVLPTLFSLSVGLFWFLLPSSVLTRIPIILFYGVGIYALCLTSNIYTVAAIRTIALLRAARGVGFALTLVTTFLVFDTLLSLRASALLVSLAIMIASFPLFLQGLWTIPLEIVLSRNLLVMSLIFSIAIGEVGLALHFWPVKVVVGSLFLTIGMYMLLGLGQAKLEGRLFKQTIREYLIIGFVVFLGMFVATSWSGI